MTAKQLKDALAAVPDDAEVFISFEDPQMPAERDTCIECMGEPTCNGDPCPRCDGTGEAPIVELDDDYSVAGVGTIHYDADENSVIIEEAS